MNSSLAKTLMATTVLVSIGLGCGDHHDDVMSIRQSVGGAILRVYPADGTINVSVSASISVKFGRSMDSVSVRQNFHLVGGTEMHEWMDSAAHHGGVGHISTRDMDDMMEWMDSMAIPGTFSWNEATDSCEFVPSSGMLADQEQMIFMDVWGMMNHGGGMMGSGQADDQYHSHHFMTEK